ncbi:MAG: PHP domain-containing protein [Treponema sp.]
MIDLHTHSTASDGTYTPSQLVNKAIELGLKVIALTDHDTLKGIQEAREAAKDRIIFIPGVEISIEWHKGDCHLLGLGVKENSYRLNSLLCTLQNAREERGYLIAKKLKEAGFDIEYEEVAKLATGTVGRPHFASYMYEHKMVKSIQEAFDKYFAIGRPFHIPKKNADLKEAIFAIKEAKGIPVLAHPMSLYRSWKYLPSIIHEFKELSLMGLEAWHPGARYTDCKRLEELAKKEKLIVTASSDFHGERRKDRFLGHTCNNMIIEDIYFENLLNAGLKL